RSILPNREVAEREQGSLYAQMLERKREKNKLAARRKRERKKQRLEHLESRKVELEHRRLTLRAELRARRRMNWLMEHQRHAVMNSDGEEQMPHFTPTDTSDSAFSADSYSGEEDVSDGNAARGSKPADRPKAPLSAGNEEETELGIELDKLRGDVQNACDQTLDTIEILNGIRSDISSLLDASKSKNA
ncbi:hypothetical protein LPJ67_005053, partial [Coemansia sp. RSA 1938]